MKNPKVSIIIPVYNTEKYLKKCLDSVINQTLKDIEIIIVNDCSPDNSEKIILEYKEKDDRIIYIKHEKNLGLGGVRNTGIEAAKGEYQWHIDSDDFIDINACEILYGTAKKYNVEVLTFSACNYTLIDGNYSYLDNYFSRDKAICSKIFQGVDFLKEARRRGVFHCALWLNLFRASFIKNFSKDFIFRENVAHQDTDYTPIIYTHAQSVFCMHYAPYYRVMRDDSVTGSGLTKKKMEDKFAVTISLLNYILKNNYVYGHPLCEFALKDFNYFLKIYNTEYQDKEKYFTNTINRINEMIEKINGYEKELIIMKDNNKKGIHDIKKWVRFIVDKIIEILSNPTIQNYQTILKNQERLLYEFREFMQLHGINQISKQCNIDLTASIDASYINNMKFVNIVYEVEKNNNANMLKKIMSFKDTSPSKKERGGPSDSVGFLNENYKKMLKRYFYAGKIFSENKRVLESCSGAGWGAFILSFYAKEVVSYDREEVVIEMCRDYWQRDNIIWTNSDALDMNFLKGEKFDVVTAMETIEHFTKEDGEKYIYNKQRFLDKGGIFIGTSLFPATREQAESSPSLLLFDDHLFLWTKQEMIDELKKYFSQVKFIGNWMFIAQK